MRTCKKRVRSLGMDCGCDTCAVLACLQFDLRNGAIRKKYDLLKYTLKKMENTLYELSLAEAGFKPQREKDTEVRFHMSVIWRPASLSKSRSATSQGKGCTGWDSPGEECIKCEVGALCRTRQCSNSMATKRQSDDRMRKALSASNSRIYGCGPAELL